jgi:hypothetical protein
MARAPHAFGQRRTDVDFDELALGKTFAARIAVGAER